MTSKIYVVVTGEWPSPGPGFTPDYAGCALAEDGNVLSSHISSSESWLQHDLGVTSERRHDIYREHYPDGFEVVYVPMDQRDSHEGLQAAIKANHALAGQP